LREGSIVQSSGADDRREGLLRSIRRFLSTHTITGQLLPSFGPDGWPDVADETPEWNTTVTATWVAPRLNYYDFVLACGLAAILVGVGVDALARSSVRGLIPLALAVMPAAWALRQLGRRGPRRTMRLLLEPTRLRLTSDDPAFGPYELARYDAGVLLSHERHQGRPRRIGLHDQRGGLVVEFADRRAELAWDPDRLNRALPSQARTAGIVGSWWPHPARRAHGGGSFYWQDHDIAGPFE
jgi:hypothetical protein